MEFNLSSIFGIVLVLSILVETSYLRDFYLKYGTKHKNQREITVMYFAVVYRKFNMNFAISKFRDTGSLLVFYIFVRRHTLCPFWKFRFFLFLF